jgi:exonuclease SbcD
MKVRIVATADNHLGRYYPRMPIGVLDERRRRIRHALGHVFAYAKENSADLLLLAGDLFDSPNPRNPERLYLARQLRELNHNGIKVAAIAGNHDAPRSSTQEGGYLALSIYHELDVLQLYEQLDGSLTVTPTIHVINGSRIAIGAFTPSPNLAPGQDPLEGVTYGDIDADFRILMVHAGIENKMFEGTEGVIKVNTLQALRNVDLLIAGNIHCYQYFQVGQIHVVIPGATEWMDFGDVKSSPGFGEIEIDEAGIVAVRHIPIEPQPRAAIELKASELDPEDPTATIVMRLEQEASKDKLARLRIEGTLTRTTYAKLNLAVIEDRARDLFFFCDVELTGLRVQYDNGAVRGSSIRRSVKDEIDHVVQSLVDLTSDDAERDHWEATRVALQAELLGMETR